MQAAALPLACFLSVIRPPGVQFENGLLQIAPVNKAKCPYVNSNNDVGFQLFTRHNPTVFQELKTGDDELLFASNIDMHDTTVVYFHAWLETPEDGSGLAIREAYMQRGDTNMIMVDARTLQAGPWYFTAAENTWYIGRYAARFIDYLVTRGLNLNNTHLVGHSLGGQVAGVTGSSLKSGKVARITALDPALPLFEKLPLEQRLDQSDAHFVDVIHTDAGIFGYYPQVGHVDFMPNAGISPQPNCELEVVLHKQLLTNKCDPNQRTEGFFTYYLQGNEVKNKENSLEGKLEKLFAFIQAVRAKSEMKDGQVTLDKVRDNIDGLYEFKDGIVEYMKGYVTSKLDTKIERVEDISTDNGNKNDNNNRTVNVSKNYKEDKENKLTHVKKQLNKEKFIKTLNKISKTGKDTVVMYTDDTEDLIAEESSMNTEGNEEYISDIENKDTLNQSRKRFKRDTNLTNVELTVFSPNLTLNKATNISKSNTSIDRIDISDINTILTDSKPKINANNSKAIKPKTTTPKPFKIDLFRPRPLLNIALRILPILSRYRTEQSNTNSIPKTRFKFPLSKLKSNPKSKSDTGFKFRPFRSLRRQKRFTSLFRKDEDNMLFKLLDFLLKHRRNVLPVFTVVREINTLVKSANGELNHVSKESNNYIGATPAPLVPVTYSLELGNENRMTAFVKKLFGIIPKGDRLTITAK